MTNIRVAVLTEVSALQKELVEEATSLKEIQLGDVSAGNPRWDP